IIEPIPDNEADMLDTPMTGHIYGTRVPGPGSRSHHSTTHSRHHHPSTSPNTRSQVPTMATTSGSMWPEAIASIDERWAKPGARTLTRNGLLAPSEIRYTPNSPLGASTAA